MTAKTIAEFIAATGREPEQDDLERVNCVDAGQIGHFACGWCDHNLPMFDCATCMGKRSQPQNDERKP